MAEVSDNGGPVPPPVAGDALFLDFDGTLLHLQDDPVAVRADTTLLALLRHCEARHGGALAIISGRSLATLDAALAPGRFAAAGSHGLDRRDFCGNTSSEPVNAERLRTVAARIGSAMEGMPMTWLEDKGSSIALHWRRAPAQAAALRALARDALPELGPHYRLLDGDCLVELVPRTAGKGNAVRAFMREAPFRGRRPVFIGDDITDLDGFAAVRRLGGIAIAVGSRVQGDYRLADSQAVRAWLTGEQDA